MRSSDFFRTSRCCLELSIHYGFHKTRKQGSACYRAVTARFRPKEHTQKTILNQNYLHYLSDTMNNKGSYPQQSVYPQQSSAPAYPPQMQMSPQAPPYTEAPPAYSEIYQPRYVLPPQVAGQATHMSSPYPGAQMFMALQPHMSVGPGVQNVPMAYYPMGAMYPHGSTVMVDGGYDAGARFGAGASTSIPPPPPGHPPNAAQLAAMQGANVAMTQRKNNFFLGGSSGGYTIW
uniref:DAZ-associated protein 2 n=1 Tax=Neogobius melanostomus TaxID=47308 RepID=A0A8C6TLP6_9GOBI